MGNSPSLFGWSDGFCASMVAYAEDGHAAMVLWNRGDDYPWDLAVEILAIVRK